MIFSGTALPLVMLLLKNLKEHFKNTVYTHTQQCNTSKFQVLRSNCSTNVKDRQPKSLISWPLRLQTYETANKDYSSLAGGTEDPRMDVNILVAAARAHLQLRPLTAFHSVLSLKNDQLLLSWLCQKTEILILC